MKTKKLKMTEVGLIPADWKLTTFGKAFHFLNSATYSRDELSDNQEVKYIHYGDIHTKWKHFLDFRKNSLPSIEYSKVKSYMFIKEGDLIMADASEDYSGIGKSVEVINIGSQKAISGLHTFLMRSKNDIFEKGFKGYIHTNLFVKKQFDKLATGMKVYGVSKSNLKTILIPFPPSKEEQTLIAKTLTDADMLIKSLEKLIFKKKDIKQSVMQKLLTRKKNWRVKKLGEIGKCIRGVSYNGERDLFSHETKKTVRLFRSNNIQEANIESSNIQYVNTEKVKETQIMQTNDILICMANGSKALVGKAALFKPKDKIKYTFGAFMGCFRIFSDEADSNYIFNNFQSRNYRAYIEILLSGSSINNLKPSDIESIEIPFPEKTEQLRIATILNDMDTEILMLEKKLKKLQLIKQGMMQSLLTGKIRLLKTNTIEAKIDTIKTSDHIQRPKHNWEFNEAVLISFLTYKFGTSEFPLGRKRYTKLSYLFHRYKEQKAEGYLKKAAGPYNPKTKYGGAEKIALTNKYIKIHNNNKFSGFIKNDNIKQAVDYFVKWYGQDALSWLEQFRTIRNDTLELWATVDMAIQEIRKSEIEVSLKNIKDLIANDKEWKDKLNKSFFSDENIKSAIIKSKVLFG